MRLVALSALGGAILASSAVMAADYAAVPPPPVWGFYFGGGVCYDWADFDIDKTKTFDVKKYKKVTYPKQVKKEKLVPDGKVWNKHKQKWETKYKKVVWYETILLEKIVHYWETVTQDKHYDGSADGPCLTATVGYDYQIDQLFLVGVFASYDWQKKSGEVTKTYGGETYALQDSKAWLGNIATVAGRAGILVQPDLLVYALLGYSWSEGGIDIKGKTLSGNISGPTIGAGIEKLFAKNWSGRFEYRLTNFGSLSGGGSCYVGKNCYETTTARITDQSVRLVLTYRP